MFRPLLLLTLAVPLAAQTPTAPAPTAAPSPAASTATPQATLAPERGRFAGLFRPFRTEQAALSPDGRHLAYSVREGEEVFVITIDLDHPTTIKARVKVVDDDAATPMMAVNQREKTPGRILWLGWVTPNRLVVQTNQVHSRNAGADSKWSSWSGVIFGFDADGANARKLAGPEDLPDMNPRGSLLINTTRPRGFQALDGAPTPDQSSLPGELAADSDLALPSDEETTTTDTTALDTQSISPRTLQVFDYDPQVAGGITLVTQGAPRGNGTRSLGLFGLNTHTAQVTVRNDALVSSNQNNLLDRQGQVRVVVNNTSLSDFPLRFEYQGTKGNNRGRPLDEVTGQTGFSVSPENYFGERSILLGFDWDPNIVYYASNVGRDTYGLYSLNLSTRERGGLTLENPAYDLVGPAGTDFPGPQTLVFDRFTQKLSGVRFQANYRTAAWLRPEWQAVQAELEKSLPGRSVQLIDWDENARRFLVTTEGPADPGAFYVYERDTKKLMEFVRRAPWVESNHTHTTLPFGFGLADGTRLAGFITVPAQPRIRPVPLLVLCPDEPWARVSPDFQRDIHALAGMGFAVVQFSGRGSWGYGRKQRTAIAAGYDLVQVEDLATLVTALPQRFQIDAKRVALFGRGHGAFIALRAVQTHPDLFRCAVALEPPVNLERWLANLRWSDDDVQPHLTRAWLGDKDRLAAAPLERDSAKITKPILVLSYPGADGAARRPLYLAARRLTGTVADHGVPAEIVDLPEDYVRGLPDARSDVFDRMEGFLNEHIYDYKVKLRDLQILPEKNGK